MILVVMVWGIAFRAKDAAAPPSPEKRAGLPPNGLRVSCAECTGAIGIFNGVADETTPRLGVTGEEWRYVYASTGSGSFSIEVLDEEGNQCPLPPYPARLATKGVAPNSKRRALLESR